MPAGPLHQVSADRGAEQRSGDRSHGEESAGHSVLLFRIAREQHALRSRDDRPAAQPLQDAEADERGQVPGQPAERARCREDEDRGRVVASEAEAPQQPSRNRDDGDVRHRIRGRDPGDLIERGPEVGADVVQRDVHDGDVQERHQAGDHRARGDEWLAPAQDGGLRAHQSLVRTMTSALMPGRSSTPAEPSRRMSTGMRWTTFTKFPVALSGGSRANRAPVAPAMLSTWP